MSAGLVELLAVLAAVLGWGVYELLSLRGGKPPDKDRSAPE